MKAVPRSRHVVAVLIFAGVSAAAGYLAMFDDRLSDTQFHIATAALKRHDPHLFTNDPVFGESKLWRFHTPAMQGGMELVLVPTRYGDPTLPFRVLAGVGVMVYLCGMYALLYRQCRIWSIAAFVAILSCVVVSTLGEGHWGIGSLASVTPGALCLAICPLIVLAFLRYECQWRVLLVFGFVGLLGNLHLVTAMNLTLVLLIVHLGRRGFSLRRLCMALGCGLFASAAALPYTFYYFGLRSSLTPPGAATSYSAVYQALEKLEVLYPAMLRSLLEWDFLGRVLVLGAAGVAVLLRVERFRVRSMNVWVWFIGAVLLVTFALQGASQLIGKLLGTAPPVIDFVRASSLLMLPLYVLFAQALTNFFRLAGRHRNALRWACVAMTAAWMLPTGNLRVVRHAVYDAYDAVLRQVEKSREPGTLRRHRMQWAKRAELERIGQWARTRSDESAVFILDRIEFRMLSRRAIVASHDDVRYFYYMAPWKLDDWADQVARQKQLLHPPTGKVDPVALERFVIDLSENPEWKTSKQWYAVLVSGRAPGSGSSLQEIVSEGWGRYYRLYRIR